MSMIPQTTEHWIKALVAAAVTGASNAGLSVLGISGAQAVGIQINQLNGRQVLAAILSGGIVGALAYLKQSPVPPDAWKLDPNPQNPPGGPPPPPSAPPGSLAGTVKVLAILAIPLLLTG